MGDESITQQGVQSNLMDWVLGITTLLANANLGWSRGASYAWLLWACNAMAWQAYVTYTGQWGFTVLSVVTMYMGLANAMRRYYKDHGMNEGTPWTTWHFKLNVWLKSKFGRRMNCGCRGFCDGHWGTIGPDIRIIHSEPE